MINVRDDDIFFNAIWRHKIFLKYKIYVHIGIIGSIPFPARWIKKHLNMYEICNHSYCHKPDMIAKFNIEKKIEDLDKANKVIKKKLGVKPNYFIPPYGRYNDQLIKACESVGLSLHPSYIMREKNKDLYYSAKTNDILGKNDGWYVCHTSKGIPSKNRLEKNMKYLYDNKLTKFWK
jgi:peptidoglycan/xylan/chitin deacetylase (PgdA/CDA1 family)